MAEKKMTRKEALEIAIAAVDGEAKEVLEKMYAQVTKPRKKSDAPTKTQILNMNLAEACYAAISEKGEAVTSKWIIEHVNGLLTPQKCTAVMRLLVNDGRVTKAKDGKVVTYTIAEQASLTKTRASGSYFYPRVRQA